MRRKKANELVVIDASMSADLEAAREEGERLERFRIVMWLRSLAAHELAHQVWVGAHMGGTESKPYRAP